MEPREIVQSLARAAGLGAVPAAERRRLVERSRIRHLARGEPLFEEGDDGKSAFVVLRGSLSIVRAVGDGRTTPVALRGGGAWVGELALLDGGERSAGAVADSEAWVLEVPRAAFEDLLLRHPRLAIELAASIGRRLRESDSALIEALQKRLHALTSENQRLTRAVARSGDGVEGVASAALFPGVSAAAERVRRAVAAAARSELPVLLLGEPGTGKEALARAIHAGSARAARPFVALDCALFGDRALEAELFGAVPGGLPASGRARTGALEEADRGTLFLAAIDALSPWLQGLLVHFLAAGEYRRAGESRLRRADVRLVAASAADVPTRARDSQMRGDLFEAIAMLRIDVPPLRARRADVPAVAAALLAELGASAGEPALHLSPGALAALARRDYAGNQRELRALLERLTEELGHGAQVSPLDLTRAIPSSSAPEPEHYSEAVRAFKRQLVSSALEHAGGSRTEAARILELHPSNLIRLMRNLGIDAP